MLLITDLAIWKPDPVSCEFTVVSLLPGDTRDGVQSTCRWEVKYAGDVAETAPPGADELTVLRDLMERTDAAHHVRPAAGG